MSIFLKPDFCGLSSVSIRDFFSAKAYGQVWLNAVGMMPGEVGRCSSILGEGGLPAIDRGCGEYARAFGHLWSHGRHAAECNSPERRQAVLIGLLSDFLASAMPACAHYAIFDMTAERVLGQFFSGLGSRGDSARQTALSWIKAKGIHHPDLQRTAEYALMLSALNSLDEAKGADVHAGVRVMHPNEISRKYPSGMPAAYPIFECSDSAKPAKAIELAAKALCPLLLSKPPQLFLHDACKLAVSLKGRHGIRGAARHILLNTQSGAALTMTAHTSLFIKERIAAPLDRVAMDAACMRAMSMPHMEAKARSLCLSLISEEFPDKDADGNENPFDLGFQATKQNLGKLCKIRDELKLSLFDL